MPFLQHTVVDELLNILHAFGVEYIYGIPGDAINDLVDGIRRQDKIRFIQVRHEETGALAASAQAKLTGKLGVCVGTAGGGAIHLLNGLYDAKLDSAPVLAITGQVTRREIGFESHQEIDSKLLFDKVAVYNETLVSDESVGSMVEHACQQALFYRGVSHLALPDDVASATVSPSSNERRSQLSRSEDTGTTILPSRELIANAVGILESAKKPLILAGIGAKQAKEELIQLAENIGAPIIQTLRAKDLLPDDHPLSLGGLGLLGTSPADDAVKQCDTLLIVGSDFPYTDYYPDKRTTVIQIDINPTHFGRRCRVDVELHGDAKPTLEALRAQSHTDKQDSFLHESQQQMKKWRDKQKSNAETTDGGKLNPKWVAKIVGEHADNNAIFICDTGAVTAWAARHLPIRDQQHFTLSANLATMGFGISGAIGAQLAYPARQIIALVGDGGFSMLMQDFLTAVKYALPINIVIFNNNKLGLIQMEQEARGYPEYQCELPEFDFCAYADLCGGKGWSIETPEQLHKALKEAAAVNKPSVLDVSVDPNTLVTPPHVTLDQAVNYSVAKVKEYLS